MVWDSLLIDGVDTANLFTVVEEFDGVEGSSGTDGANYSVPGRDGEVWRRKPLAAGTVSVGIAILGVDPETGEAPSTRAERIARLNGNWQTIKRLVGVRRRPLTLSRRLSLPDGDEITLTAQAELASPLSLGRLNAETGRTVLSFRLLDGCWFSKEPLTYTVEAGDSVFLPAPGTVDTSNMTVVFSGGAAGTYQRLTNVSAGKWLSYDWTVFSDGSALDPTSVIRVDVPAFESFRNTASQPTLNSPTNSRLFHGGTDDPQFMVIDPDLGDNEFTITSGKAVITYYPGWL